MDRVTLNTGRKAVIIPFVRAYCGASLRSVVSTESVRDYYATMTTADRREWRADYAVLS
jgi:hypothetical protein